MQTDERSRRFWRLLADYEELTRGETAGVQHRDYPSLESAQKLKSALLPAIVREGEGLGLSRENCPELRTRLEAVAIAEAGNLRKLDERREVIQKRVTEMNAAWARLRSVKKNYKPEAPLAAPVPRFAACG